MRVLAGVLTVIAAALSIQCSRNSGDLLQRHRNLGQALYENPTTHAEAIAEFKKALDQAPNSPAEKLNYALALLRGGQTAEAVARLEEVQRLAPNLPHTWFNLGIYYKKAGEVQKATGEFERRVSLVPGEPIAHYQLGALYRDAGRLADARSQFERAAELDPLLAAPHFQLYSLYRQNGNSEASARPAGQGSGFNQSGRGNSNLSTVGAGSEARQEQCDRAATGASNARSSIQGRNAGTA